MERRLVRFGIQGVAAVAALTLAACGQPYPNPTPEAPPPPPPAADLAGGPETPPPPPPPPVASYPAPDAYPAPPGQAPGQASGQSQVFIAMQPIPNPPETRAERRRERHERHREVRRAEAHGYTYVPSHHAAPAHHLTPAPRVVPAPHHVAPAPHPAPAPHLAHPPVIAAKPVSAKPAPVPAKPAPVAPAKPAPAPAPVVKPAAKVEAPKVTPAAKPATPNLAQAVAPPTLNSVGPADNAEGASPLGDRATRLASLETSLAEAVKKGAELKTPPTFTAGKAEDITLTLPADFADTAKDLATKNDLAEAVTSVNLTAVLSGDGFTVMPDTAQSQPLAAGQPTVFKWSVTPADGAKGPLHADIGADLLGSGSDTLSLGSIQADNALGFMKSSRMLGIGILALLAVLVIAWLVRGRGEPVDSVAARQARRERGRPPVQLGGGDEL